MRAGKKTKGAFVSDLLMGAQIKMARAALGWSVPDLSKRSGVSSKTIWRIEKSFSHHEHTTIATLKQLRRTFEANGVTFLDDDGRGVGVRCLAPPDEPE